MIFLDFNMFGGMNKKYSQLKSKRDRGYEKQKIEITQMWANQQNDGSHHPPHTHGNSILSGIYYIKATDNSSGTQFFDPKIQAHRFKPRRKENN